MLYPNAGTPKTVITQLPLVQCDVVPGRGEPTKADVTTERSRVIFRPMALVLFEPDPALFVLDIIGPDRCFSFAASGCLPALMFSQEIPLDRRIPLTIGTVTPADARLIVIRVEYRGYRGKRPARCSGFFEGVASLYD